MREIDRRQPTKEEIKRAPIKKDDEGLLLQTSQDLFLDLQKFDDSFWPEDIRRSKGKIFDLLQEDYKIVRLGVRKDPYAFERYHRTRRKFLTKLANDIRRRRSYHILPRLLEEVRQTSLSSRVPEIITQTIGGDFMMLYILLCKEDKILAGTREGTWWKPLYPENYSEEERSLFWLNVAHHMRFILTFIGESQLDLVPEHFVSIKNLARLNLNKPERPIEDLLDDAFFNRRYTVPPEGAEVRFLKGGDLKKMIIKQWRKKVFAKAVTTLGEALIWVDVDTADFWAPEITEESLLPGAPPPEMRLPHILAEAYRDLVIAIELPEEGRRKRRRGVAEPREEKEPPPRQPIYIPRIIRIGDKELRLPRWIPYTGRRPPRPHWVTGHKRKGNMTEEHRRVLEEFERVTGKDIFSWLPEGHTYVRGHLSPREARLEEYPVFIQRRVKSEIEADSCQLLEQITI